MASNKTTIERLADDIADLLDEYEGEVRENVREIVKKMTKKGAQALKSESKAQFKGSGVYAGGWKVDNTGMKRNQVSFSSVIYNEHPGLPHLLEFGHVTRNGTGRTFDPTPAHPHIAPIEQELIKTFEREVKRKL